MKMEFFLWGHLSQCRERQSLGRHAIEPHALKTGKMYRPAIQRWNGIDADSIQAVRTSLIKRDYVRMSLDHIQQKIFIADLGQTCFLLVLSHSFHVVDFRFLDAN